MIEMKTSAELQRIGRVALGDMIHRSALKFPERTAVVDAETKLEAARTAQRRAEAASGIPLPTRVEAGLTVARADVSLAETALERTRIRAPRDATGLNISARVGETATPSPASPVGSAPDNSVATRHDRVGPSPEA